MSVCLLPAGMEPVTTFSSYYLGQPGAMTKLRLPDAGIAAPLSRGEVAHALASGGTSTTRRRRAKRAYTLAMSAMTADDADTILSYYLGGRGNGPWAFCDPTYRNQLGQDDSTFGTSIGTNTVYAAPAADAQPFIDNSFAPALPGSNVLRWPTPVNSHIVCEGTNPSGTMLPDPLRAAPYLSDQTYVVSVYARTVSGTANAIAYALGSPASGWAGLTVASGTIGLTTTWQRISMAVSLGLWSPTAAPYITLAFQSASASSPDLLWSNAQIDCGVSTALPWVTGLGVPRVTISTGLTANVARYWRRDHGYTLSEV